MKVLVGEGSLEVSSIELSGELTGAITGALFPAEFTKNIFKIKRENTTKISRCGNFNAYIYL